MLYYHSPPSWSTSPKSRPANLIHPRQHDVSWHIGSYCCRSILIGWRKQISDDIISAKICDPPLTQVKTVPKREVYFPNVVLR